MDTLPKELISEIVSHLPQRDRLNCLLINKNWYNIVIKLIYRRIYLNDSNVVRSDFIDIAINWTLIYIPSFLTEEESRDIANIKLDKLIKTLSNNNKILESVEWIRINWDLDPILQRNILNLLCFRGKSLKRLENVTDPSCNNIIINGTFSKKNLTSFDMAPPNSLPELQVDSNYIPNLIHYLNERISTNLSHMTLFIDPLKLFNYLYHLKEKLTIIDLKLHWRREFYSPIYFQQDKLRSPKLTTLTDIFDIRTLKTLTIISWNESLMTREIEMIKEFKKFIFLEDLSLISIKQDTNVLTELFNKLTNLKRLKMDFLEDFVPETTNPQIFLSILLYCKKLQFIDIRFEGIDSPIINMNNNKFEILQKCYCNDCQFAFDNILKRKIFLFPIDYYMTDIQDIAAKDIYKMMRYLSLLPYSKACDCYPSVRTQPMNLDEFVNKMNNNLINYRFRKQQLLKPNENGTSDNNNNTSSSSNGSSTNDTNIEGINNNTNTDNDTTTNDNMTNLRTEPIDALFSARIMNQKLDDLKDRLPHEPLNKDDVIKLYHALIHHFKKTYFAFLKGFPHLRFLMLNDIPTITIEENSERIFHPIFYHFNYKSNLNGWSQQINNLKNLKGNNDDDTVTRRATFI